MNFWSDTLIYLTISQWVSFHWVLPVLGIGFGLILSGPALFAHCLKWVFVLKKQVIHHFLWTPGGVRLGRGFTSYLFVKGFAIDPEIPRIGYGSDPEKRQCWNFWGQSFGLFKANFYPSGSRPIIGLLEGHQGLFRKRRRIFSNPVAPKKIMDLL